MNTKNWEVVTNRVLRLNTKWLHWQQLFGTDDAVTDLNRTAPSCFALIQESMLVDVINSIARLLDAKANKKQANLVIESLFEDVPRDEDKVRLQTALNDIKSNGIDQVRHKVIAHEDLAVATGMKSVVPVDSALISQCISQINSLMSDLEAAASVPHKHSFGPVELKGSGATVLWLIQRAYGSLVQSRSALLPVGVPPVPDDDHLALTYVRSSL